MQTKLLRPALAVFIAQLAACSANPQGQATNDARPYTVDDGRQAAEAPDAKDAGTLPLDSAAVVPSSDVLTKDSASEPEAANPSCPGIQHLVAGDCVCPTNMDPKGAACVETFDHASKPAEGWVWENCGCMGGCYASDTGEGCNGTLPWPDPACDYLIGGNVGWAIVDSPAPGGGKALREFSYSNNGCCWQGDTIHKTYALGRSYRVDEIGLSLYGSATGSGELWHCGSISVTLSSDGEGARTANYSDGVHGSQTDCVGGGPVLPYQGGGVVFDLAQAFAASEEKTFNEITLRVYAYSCGAGGHGDGTHSVTIDDVTLELKPSK
jgi:hypothetical protein